MMGIPISWSTYMYRGKMEGIYSNSKPELTLKKRCNTIAYHAICESVAVRESMTEHVRSYDDLADLLTKEVSGKT